MPSTFNLSRPKRQYIPWHTYALNHFRADVNWLIVLSICFHDILLYEPLCEVKMN